MSSNPIRWLTRLARPLNLVIGILMYFLGAGIAVYLGYQFDWSFALTGLFWVLSMLIAMHSLLDYFDPQIGGDTANLNPFTGSSGALGVGRLPRPVAFWIGLGALTVAASLTVVLLNQDLVNPPTLLVMVLLISGVLFLSIPPIRLVSSGYGELTLSIWMANLIPAFAFLLQTGELHRLLAMTTFSLTALHLVIILAYQFSDFARDLKYENQTLLVRMGWRSGMLLHNILILTAFLLLGVASVFGLPQIIALPALLPLPLGLLEIWQMARIGAGGQPNWRSLKLNAVTVFIATAYLLAFAFWTR